MFKKCCICGFEFKARRQRGKRSSLLIPAIQEQDSMWPCSLCYPLIYIFSVFDKKNVEESRHLQIYCL